MHSDSFCRYDSFRPFLRFPRHGRIDLTYRCNNQCRHCWLSIPADSPRIEKELSADDIFRIALEARQMGCNEWSISGGEPMLRPDFSEIFDFLTRKVVSYTLNTNGSLITPEIAKLLTRRGNKIVAFYGADAAVHDKITRTPGSFEAFLRGCAYLKKAGAGFSVQVVPMRDNFQQLDAMLRLAESLSSSYRIGASWLYLSAHDRARRNPEIRRQRLLPSQVVAIDPTVPGPDFSPERRTSNPHSIFDPKKKDRLFHSCINERQEFHIDPYGTMSFCIFIKEPSLRFDLQRWGFKKIWDELIPQVAERVLGGDTYRQNCVSCRLSDTCQWCAAYAYLENKRFSAPVAYLCRIAKEREKASGSWLKNNRRYFQIAGMNVQVDSDLLFTETTFGKCFDSFRIEKPGRSDLRISHHFGLPDLPSLKNAERVYKRKPWEIYRQGSSWIYVGIGPRSDHSRVRTIAVFSDDHTRVRVYHKDDCFSRVVNLGALTAFPSDQIMLSRVLADRQGCFMHSAGLVLNGQGILFVGPSGAGKSTTVKRFGKYGEVLCDDRVIVRRWPKGFFIHGSWSHGEIPLVSNSQAPLKAILFLEKAKADQLVPLADKKQVLHHLLFRVVRPFVTTDWWEKTITLLSALADDVPAYRFLFTKHTRELNVLESLVGKLETSPPMDYEGRGDGNNQRESSAGKRSRFKARENG